MRKSLKGKILFGIIIVILGTYMFINSLIWRVLQDHLERYIKEDMDKVKGFAYLEITRLYDEQALGSKIEVKNKVLPVLGSLNKSYKTYISLDIDQKEKIAFTGSVIDNVAIQNIIRESGKKASVIYMGVMEEKFCATYSYPVYINNDYKGTLILQKDYMKEYTNYKKIMLQIRLLQAGAYSMMIGLIYFWLSKATYSLKFLAANMREIGEGNFTSQVEIKGNDEIADLAKTFNQMKVKIAGQIDEIYEEKKKGEELERNRKEFFNYATHEMKTPLTAIKGYAGLLGQEDEKDEVISRMYHRISLETDRMHRLVENMLVVARGREKIEEVYEYFDLKGFVEGIIRTYEVIFQKENKNISLQVQPYTIFAIREEIRTVFTNLIDNAIKYSIGKDIRIISQNESPWEITIENKSKPIPDNVKDHLLEPFAKYNYEDHKKVSSGLGLFICKELMNKYNGGISYRIEGEIIYFILSFEILDIE